MAFQPKQITQYEASHLDELQGDVSETAIKYSLTLIPSISAGAVIHDNAAGSGAVTATIMAQLPNETKSQIHIDATDCNTQFITGCKALAESNGWPVSTAVMSAQELTFLDNTFTHSFTSFAFHCLGDHDTAARQIYRTLKPGGIAVASIWVYMPHVEALQHAHWLTRGRDGPMPVLLPLESFQVSNEYSFFWRLGLGDFTILRDRVTDDWPDRWKAPRASPHEHQIYDIFCPAPQKCEYTSKSPEKATTGKRALRHIVLDVHILQASAFL